MPTRDIVEVVVYVAPGFLCQQLIRAVYPHARRGEFSQVAWSIVYSVLILHVVRKADQALFQGILYSAAPGFPAGRFVAALFGGGIALGGSIIILFGLRYALGRRFSGLSWIVPNSQSTWADVNRPSNNDWAVVFLEDGSIYLGWIAKYAFDPDKEHQDFVLSRAKRVDDKLQEIYVIDGTGVYLNTRDVRRIEFVKGRPISTA